MKQEEIMKGFSELIGEYDKWKDEGKRMRHECITLIREALTKTPNESIDFDDCDTVTVTYDETHAEKFESSFSKVDRIYLLNDEIVLDTEDCSDYPINNVWLVREVCEIASVVYDRYRAMRC